MENKDTLAVRDGNWLIDQVGSKVTLSHSLRAGNDVKVMEFDTSEVEDLYTAIQCLAVHLKI